MKQRKKVIVMIGSLVMALLTACSSGTEDISGVDSEGQATGWSEESHSNEAEPNYDVVFPEDEVNQITITIEPEEWTAMQENMTDLFGQAGLGGKGGGFPGGERPEGGNAPEGFRPGEGQPPEGFQPGEDPPEGFEPPQREDWPERQEGGQPNFEDGNRGPGGGLGGGDMTPENPMWVSATIEFEGKTWTNVGVRYKGNSSLTSGWQSGTLKLPLKLDFDEFEDEYPEIEDQRFYGFKQLSLANGFSDDSFMRDAVTSQILEDAGLPVAETAFYEVILDYGEGPVSLGLYTMIEVVDDTVIPEYFGSDDGNIYEAEGSAASFAASTFDQIEDSFQKENNEDEADWSDIEELFNVLHSNLRTTDPSAWRDELESVFDTDSFLEWLAIAAVLDHWDSYGSMSHNYYLYHDSDTDLLTWISWDHNMVMNSSIGGAAGRGGGRTVTLDKDAINDNWPLIRFLLDDPVYYQKYLTYLEETIDGPFNSGEIIETYQEMAELIAPYASADVGQEKFEAAVDQLIQYAEDKAIEVEDFLQSTGR